MDTKEKLKIHEDQVKAMLMDMILIFCLKNTQTSSQVTNSTSKSNFSGECWVLCEANVSDNTWVTAEADAVPPPAKNEKVSYHHVAGELLKYW